MPLVTAVGPNGSPPKVGALPATGVARVAPLPWIPIASSAGMAVHHAIVGTFRRSITQDRLPVWSTLPPAAVLGGLLGQLPGARTTLWAVGLASALSFLWIHCSPPRTPRDISDDHILGGSQTGTARQQAAGAGESASVPGARPAGDDRTDFA
ncbi:hypothetical protein OG601_40545 [Streptomyces sp. NBC_01239]|uniref:hypothetical protein n=1 Tax=Streptomyces sp. NBC_01239 TaxID=2903792 RepID=UPI002259D90A|nr:hypothetical protein [Streptomyces sp. NBC_01239]MCX4816886.1 hypothetical protein [Streptomyces sp. NBC_01239]